MKGIIFIAFFDMVEEKYGLATRLELIKKTHLANGGSYTAGGTYPDAELIKLIQKLAAMKHLDVQKLVEEYGVYTFSVFAKHYPIFFKSGMTLKEFLKSIDHVVHVEVDKLYSEANLPFIDYEDPAPNKLVMLYRSPRKLCRLAIGLIKGAALHYNQKVAIKQPICMHKGADHCRLEITFEKPQMSTM